MRDIIRTHTEGLIVLLFIALRYFAVMVFFVVMLQIGKWSTASDHITDSALAFDWMFTIFYTAINAIFVVHVAIFIFWRKK